MPQVLIALSCMTAPFPALPVGARTANTYRRYTAPRRTATPAQFCRPKRIAGRCKVLPAPNGLGRGPDGLTNGLTVLAADGRAACSWRRACRRELLLLALLALPSPPWTRFWLACLRCAAAPPSLGRLLTGRAAQAAWQMVHLVHQSGAQQEVGSVLRKPICCPCNPSYPSAPSTFEPLLRPTDWKSAYLPTHLNRARRTLISSSWSSSSQLKCDMLKSISMTRGGCLRPSAHAGTTSTLPGPRSPCRTPR